MSEEKKRSMSLNDKRMKEAEFLRSLWVVTVETGTIRSDLLTPEFWSHVAYRFKPYDRIEVRCDDGLYFAEYLVLSCDRTWAKVKELSFIALTSEDIAMTQDELEIYEYKFRGPHGKHSIIRKHDKAVMIEKLDSKELAMDWLTNHKKVIAA